MEKVPLAWVQQKGELIYHLESEVRVLLQELAAVQVQQQAEHGGTWRA